MTTKPLFLPMYLLRSEWASENAEQAKNQAEQAREQAEQARRSAIPRLLAMGLTTAQVAEALDLTLEEVQASSSSIGC